MSAIRGGKRPVFLLKSMCNNHGSPLDFYYEFNIIVIIRKLLNAFAWNDKHLELPIGGQMA